MIKQLFIITSLALCLNTVRGQSNPQEGVYPLKMIPVLSLKSLGLAIEPTAIHNNSGSGLTMALVDFGGFTGSFVSGNGLLATTTNELITLAKPLSFKKLDSTNKYFFADSAAHEIEAKGLSCTITDPYGNTLKILDLRFVYCSIIENAQNDNGSKDFVLLRAYVSADGKPAVYNKNNIPFVPAKTVTINSNGAGMNDFIFLMGFSKSKRYQTKEEVAALEQQAIIDKWFVNLYESNALLRIGRHINKFKTALDGQPSGRKETYFTQHIDNLKQAVLSDYQKLQIDKERNNFIEILNSAGSLSPGINVDAVRKITDRNTDASYAIKEFVNDIYGFTKLKEQKYVFTIMTKSYKSFANYNDGLLVFENEISRQLSNTKIDRENTYQLGLQSSRLLFTFGKISDPPAAFSGSPVFNAKGELVGVINAKLNMVDIRTIIGVTSQILNGQTLLSELGVNN